MKARFPKGNQKKEEIMQENLLFKAEIVARGIDRKNLANELGINASTLSKKINGLSDWNLAELRKLGTIFGVEKVRVIFLI